MWAKDLESEAGELPLSAQKVTMEQCHLQAEVLWAARVYPQTGYNFNALIIVFSVGWKVVWLLYVSGGNQTSPAKLSFSSPAPASEKRPVLSCSISSQTCIFWWNGGIKTFQLSRWKQTPELESGREVELLDLSCMRSPGESHSSGYSSYAAVELA